MSSPVLARADRLMRRRSTRSADSDEVPVLVDAIDPGYGHPGSHRCRACRCGPEPLPETMPAAAPQTGVALDGEMLDIIAHELARRVHDRLAAELPNIVETTIREFLGEPEIMALLRPRD